MAIPSKFDLPQGTLDLLILRVVALGPVHGYAIAQRIQQISKEALQVQQGSLYPALHRLENKNFLSAEWGPTETGREAKFYRLTAKGRTQLKSRDRELGAPDGSGGHDSSASARRERVNWLQRLLRSGRMEQELDTELRFHFESQVADKMQSGMTGSRGAPRDSPGVRRPGAGQAGLPRESRHALGRIDCAGPALRGAHPGKVAGLFGGCDPGARPRHRRQHAVVQPVQPRSRCNRFRCAIRRPS